MSPRALMDKMARIIDTSPIKQKPIVERFLSLANRQLHVEFEQSKKNAVFGDWGIIGGWLGLEKRFVNKFGPFIARSKAIYEGETNENNRETYIG